MKNKDIPAYMIYDGRYRFDEDRAMVFDTAEDLEEAVLCAKEHGDCVVVNSKTGTIEWDSELE